MLKKYHLEVPENLEEFWNVCETLKQNGILPYGANTDFGLSLPAMCAGLGHLYQDPQSEALTAKLRSGETPISTYMRDGFTLLKTMIDKGYLDVEKALATLPGSDEESAFFCRRQLRIYQRHMPCQGVFLRLSLCGGNDCLSGPAGRSGLCCWGGQRLAVNPKSEHLEEALLIVENMCTVQILDTFAEKFGKISSAQGNRAATVPQAEPLISCITKGNQIPNQDFSLPFNTWNTIKALCVELCKGASVEQICQEYDEMQLEEIQKYGK